MFLLFYLHLEPPIVPAVAICPATFCMDTNLIGVLPIHVTLSLPFKAPNGFVNTPAVPWEGIVNVEHQLPLLYKIHLLLTVCNKLRLRRLLYQL